MKTSSLLLSSNSFFILKFIALFEELEKNINHPSVNAENINRLFNQLTQFNSIINQQLSEDEIKKFVILLEPFRNRFIDIYYQTEIEMEKNAAAKYLSDQMKADDYLYERYQKIVSSQIDVIAKYVKLTDQTKCLFVGGGPFPISAMILARQKNIAHIDVLDKDSVAVKLAKGVIEKSGLSDKIKILDSEDASFYKGYKNYDVVIFAAMIGKNKEEKKSIYFSVSKNLTKGQHLFTRASYPNTLSNFYYSPFPFDDLADLFEKIEFSKIHPDINFGNVVLRKK